MMITAALAPVRWRGVADGRSNAAYVSTTCGSGWLWTACRQIAITDIVISGHEAKRNHPLPQVVLTTIEIWFRLEHREMGVDGSGDLVVVVFGERGFGEPCGALIEKFFGFVAALR